MANEDKKDFNAMLHDSKDMPKFQIITDQKSIEKYGGSRMYFAPPIEYDKVMKLIPYGKVDVYKRQLLKRIGVDGVRYEEFFITSFDGDVLGLYDYLTEYENLDELNHLACLLSELDQGDLEKFEAVIDSGEHTSSVADLINLAQNPVSYTHLDVYKRQKQLLGLDSPSELTPEQIQEKLRQMRERKK